MAMRQNKEAEHQSLQGSHDLLGSFLRFYAFVPCSEWLVGELLNGQGISCEPDCTNLRFWPEKTSFVGLGILTLQRGGRIRGPQHKHNTHFATKNEKFIWHVGAVPITNQYNGIRGETGVGSLQQKKDVPLNVSDGPIIVFHGASGIACKSGCKYTWGVLAYNKDVRNGCTLSLSCLNAVCGKDNVCRCDETIGKTTSYNSGGATGLHYMNLPFVHHLLGNGCPCVFVPVHHGL